MNKSKASGYEHERYCAEYLRKREYTDIKIILGSY